MSAVGVQGPIGRLPGLGASAQSDIGRSLLQVIAARSADRTITPILPIIKSVAGVDVNATYAQLRDSIPGPAKAVVAFLADKQVDALDAPSLKQLSNLVGSSLGEGLRGAGSVVDLLRKKKSELGDWANLASGFRKDWTLTSDQVTSLVNIGSVVLGGLIKDPQTARAFQTTAQFAMTALQATGFLSTGAMSAVGAASGYGAAIALMGSFMGGGGGGTSAVVVEAIETVRKEIHAFRAEMNARLDVIEGLQVNTLNLLGKAIEEIRAARMDLGDQISKAREELEQLSNYARHADRERRYTEFRTEASAVQVEAANRIAGSGIDLGVARRAAVSYYEYARSVAAEPAFAGAPTATLSLDLNAAGRIELASAQYARVTDLLGVGTGRPIHNPREWARGVQAFLETLALFPEIQNPAFDVQARSLWDIGLQIHETLNSVGGSQVVQAAIDRYQDRTSKAFARLSKALQESAQTIGIPAKVGQIKKFSISGDFVTYDTAANMSKVRDVWSLDTEDFSIPMHVGNVMDNPIDLAIEIGLLEKVPGNDINESDFIHRAKGKNWTLVFKKGRFKDAPAGENNHFPLRYWDATFGSIRGFKDGSRANNARMTFWVVQSPTVNRRGVKFLEFLHDEIVLTLGLQPLTDTMPGVLKNELANLDDIAAALRLAAGAADWRRSDTADVATERAFRDRRLPFGKDAYDQMIRRMSIGFAPWELPAVTSLLAGQPVVAKAAAEAASKATADAAVSEDGSPPIVRWDSIRALIDASAALSALHAFRVDRTLDEIRKSVAATDGAKSVDLVQSSLWKLHAYLTSRGVVVAKP